MPLIAGLLGSGLAAGTEKPMISAPRAVPGERQDSGRARPETGLEEAEGLLMHGGGPRYTPGCGYVRSRDISMFERS